MTTASRPNLSDALARRFRPQPAARYVHPRADVTGAEVEHDFELDVAGDSKPNYHRWIAEMIEPHLGPDVLEIGAGIGSVTQYYAAGRSLVVTDLSDTCVAALRGRFASYPSVTVLQEDVRQLHPSERRFDAIVMVNVLEHIQDDLGLLLHLRSLLLPRGRIVLYVPALNALYGGWDRKLGHCRRYSKWRLAAIADAAELTVIELRYANLLSIPGWVALTRSNPARTPSGSVSIWDRTGVPLSRALERRVRVPVGLNLLAAFEAKAGARQDPPAVARS